jgi:cold shock CspA family protein
MMNETAPSPETVRLIARILGARQTSQEEVPDLIASVHRAVTALETAKDAPVEVLEPPADALPEPARERRTRLRRERPVFVTPDAPTPVAATPQLMRRTEVARTPAPVSDAATAKTRTALRGIVKWYDPKNRAGALRLPGHDDVAVDADALERAGVPRLFKGQEIEASVIIEANGAARLLAMSLPGRPETETVTSIGSNRRQKPVVIELKRDALKRVGARLEAEQILGGPRR